MWRNGLSQRSCTRPETAKKQLNFLKYIKNTRELEVHLRRKKILFLSHFHRLISQLVSAGAGMASGTLDEGVDRIGIGIESGDETDARRIPSVENEAILL